MPGICLYLQVHQPYRLKDYPFDRIGKDHAWEDTATNIAILNRLADRCYLPANEVLLKAILKSDGRFRLAFSVSGICLEQLFRHRPDVLDSFRRLAATGCVEFLAETYYHSLAGLFSHAEFRRQVVKHEKAVQQLLEVRPVVFRNSELLFSDELLPAIKELGYKTIIAEGRESNLSGNSVNQLFSTSDSSINLLPRNAGLSEEIAFRFYELSRESGGAAAAFARKIQREAEQADCISIGLDYENFGGYYSEESGILQLLENLPEEVQRYSGLEFVLPSDIVKSKEDKGPVYHSSGWTSWSEETKNEFPFKGNHMQMDALKQLYSCEFVLYRSGMSELLDQWGRLQCSDHFRNMSTRYQRPNNSGSISGHSSPYDVYLNYMNVLSSFRLAMAAKR